MLQVNKDVIINNFFAPSLHQAINLTDQPDYQQNDSCNNDNKVVLTVLLCYTCWLKSGYSALFYSLALEKHEQNMKIQRSTLTTLLTSINN